ncbi:MAG TPA: molybdate ABC transporter substrate-binding protein [Planctomicrobium sp.]|nr:molybdate ABC transporter substrate-binding protein [Planctomicrobium sp.]
MTGQNRFRVLSLVMLLLPVVSLAAGCSRDADVSRERMAAAPERLSIAAAANLKFAFDEILTAFRQQHPQIDVEITYGSSGNFFAQISQGAPFDIFFSADTTSPQKLVDEGFAERDSWFLYASGRIVVWVRNDSPLDLETLGIRAVIDPGVKKIAIANPRLAPYGVAAEEAFRTFGISRDELDARLVLGENITQAAHFVVSGGADVGILALSLALSSEMKRQGRYWEIPSDAHQPIDQAAVIMTHSRNRTAAGKFQDFVAGPEGRSILTRYGYSSPTRKSTWTGQPSGSP